MQREVLPVRTAAARRAEGVRTGRSVGRARVPAVLRLQRDAGNRAVSRLLTGQSVVQRVVELYVHGGGRVTDVNGPGTNERKPVLFVQKRLIAVGALSEEEAAADRAKMDAQTGRIMAGDIPNTIAAITKCAAPTLSEPPPGRRSRPIWWPVSAPARPMMRPTWNWC